MPDKSEKFLYFPVKDGIVTSPYGNREDPITKTPSFHKGIDIAVKDKEIDVPVLAAAKGRINFIYEYGSSEKATWNNLGNFILQEVKGGNLYIILYAHLKKVFPNIAVNKTINPKIPLGLMGDTGRTTGKVLHFQVGREVANNHLDPMSHFIDFKGA